jgi:signal recognition particle subunit SRP54
MGEAPQGPSATKMKVLSDSERNAKKAQRRREREARKKNRK